MLTFKLYRSSFIREAMRHINRTLTTTASSSISPLEAYPEEESATPKPLKLHQLEQHLGDCSAAVTLRRECISRGDSNFASNINNIPVAGSQFDHKEFYDKIYGVNCENVIGFIPIPVGVVGPLLLNNKTYYVPLATTEGALIASINRGANLIAKSGGCFSEVFRDGMTRSPVVKLYSSIHAVQFAQFLEDDANMPYFTQLFSETTKHGKLKSVTATVAGRYVYIRFTAETGDAMGMNMVGKGVDHILKALLSSEDISTSFGSVELISLSSNMCTDKKPSAVNWIHGRGKSVICEAKIPESILRSVLHVSIDDLIELNQAKNMIGSALAGSIGGNNAHTSNIVTAVFLATGQDPAQNVESSNCMLVMEKISNVFTGVEDSLHVSVTLPSLEVGTIGGGTALRAQNGCLKLLGLNKEKQENSKEESGANSKELAKIIAGTVLAGELSLNAALCSNHLISAHMKLNRKNGEKTTSVESSSSAAVTSKSVYSETSLKMNRSFSGVVGGNVKRGYMTESFISDSYLQYYDEPQFMDNKLPVP